MSKDPRLVLSYTQANLKNRSKNHLSDNRLDLIGFILTVRHTVVEIEFEVAHHHIRVLPALKQTELYLTNDWGVLVSRMDFLNISFSSCRSIELRRGSYFGRYILLWNKYHPLRLSPRPIDSFRNANAFPEDLWALPSWLETYTHVMAALWRNSETYQTPSEATKQALSDCSPSSHRNIDSAHTLFTLSFYR